MKHKKYDIVVIGAGPAGSVTARNLANKGYKVLLCEKRPVVGVPVRCGEAVTTRQRLSDFTDINERYIETDVHGVIIVTPKHRIKYNKRNCGLMIDRAIFDQDLAAQAEQAGAELCLDARVSSISSLINSRRNLEVVTKEGTHNIVASMVVGADGVESLCGQMVGLKCRQMPKSTCSTIEFRIKGEDAHPHHLSFWTHYSGIDKGYVWVFPKVKSNVINIGCGKITPHLQEPNMHEVMMKFKEEFFPKNKIVTIHGGAVPVSGNIREYVSDRFLLTGDAAHHTNPLTGGGIISAMQGAVCSSQWIDKAFKTGNFSREFFKGYEDACWKTFGKYHQKQMRIREFVLGLPKKDENIFFDILNYMVVHDFSIFSKFIGYVKVFGLLLRNFAFIRRLLRKTKKL